MLAALGWDVTAFDDVVREWRVFDNTALDYALKIDDTPALDVEAKGLNKNLEEKQFIAQTVTYANNDCVVWCVLTNGLTYRVYKTNEPVAMDQKLLFEVDLAEIADGGAAAAKPLQLLSRRIASRRRVGSLGRSACSPIRACARRSRNRQSLEIYSRIALADAQQAYDQAIGRYPV